MRRQPLLWIVMVGSIVIAALWFRFAPEYDLVASPIVVFGFPLLLLALAFFVAYLAGRRNRWR